jgi:hypothetical protein
MRPPAQRRPFAELRTLSGLSSHACSNSRWKARVKLSTATSRKMNPTTPMLVDVPDAGENISRTASAPPPLRS